MAKYSDYSGSNAYFINPYNFVNIDFDRKPPRKRLTEPFVGKSGVLHCELITKTPLSIPDVAGSDLSKSHKEYGFMRDNGVPIIPGSSLRGSIRNVFEALTDSCLSTVDADQTITYRTKRAFDPGLICIDDNGEYHLYSAKRYIFGVHGGSYAKYDKEPKLFKVDYDKLSNYEYGQKVYVSPVIEDEKEKVFKTKNGYPTKSVFIKEMSTEESDALKEGYICIGEPFSGKKHFESVFVKGKEIACPSPENGKSVLAKSVKDLSEIIKIYNDEKVNRNAKNRSFYKNRKYKEIKRGQLYPVWYSLLKENESVVNVHLSVANLGRAAYNNSMGDMLSDYKKCNSREGVCPACSLFGMVGKENLGSRIRFSDAYMDHPEQNTSFVVLKELSSPKVSYMPFYLVKKDGMTDKSISYDNSSYMIRGRKFYYHNTTEDAYLEPNGKKSDRNASVELIGKGKRFTFDVFYDNLSEKEFDRLVWSLTLGENNADGQHCHKIGHGKPIGLGSVKITIISYDERNYCCGKYEVKHIEQPKATDDVFDILTSLCQVKTITNIESCLYPVKYPVIVDSAGNEYNDGSNDHASHQWFTSNYALGSAPERGLPEIGKENDKESALVLKTDGKGVKREYKPVDNSALLNESKAPHIEIGSGYSGSITGYNADKTLAKVKLENGGRAFVYYKNVEGAEGGKIDKTLKPGEKVVVKYQGKDAKGRDKWTVAGK